MLAIANNQKKGKTNVARNEEKDSRGEGWMQGLLQHGWGRDGVRERSAGSSTYLYKASSRDKGRTDLVVRRPSVLYETLNKR